MRPMYFAVIIATILIAGSMVLTLNKSNVPDEQPENNVAIVGGQQVIDIRAKGGYVPRTTKAKAGIPTIVRFHTNGTFDCSSSVRIPSMGVSRSLPITGTTDVAIANPQAGSLQGMCGMGMYPFEINFQN